MYINLNKPQSNTFVFYPKYKNTIVPFVRGVYNSITTNGIKIKCFNRTQNLIKKYH